MKSNEILSVANKFLWKAAKNKNFPHYQALSLALLEKFIHFLNYSTSIF